MRPTSGFHTCWLMRNVRPAQMYDKQVFYLNERAEERFYG